MSRNVWIVLAAITAIGIVGLVVAALVVPPIVRGPAVRTIGDERAFGGFDPHLHVAVTAWRVVGPVEEALRPTTRWMATVGVRNSARDIAIEPAALAFAVVTGDGREFPARALPATEAHGPIRTRLP